MTGPWEGMSLQYVRTVLGQPARYPTAADACAASDLNPDDDPPTGALVWYETYPYGNVALTIGALPTGMGDPWVLCVDHLGWPTLRPYDTPLLGQYLGWSRTIGPVQ